MTRERKKDGGPQAAQLLARWTALARHHVATGGGCSCGGAHAPPLRLQDFEQDILDFIAARHAGNAEVHALLQGAAGYRAGDAGDLAALLAALAQPPASDAASLRPLLADLARSLDSFADLHPGR